MYMSESLCVYSHSGVEMKLRQNRLGTYPLWISMTSIYFVAPSPKLKSKQIRIIERQTHYCWEYPHVKFNPEVPGSLILISREKRFLFIKFPLDLIQFNVWVNRDTSSLNDYVGNLAPN